MTLTPTGFHAWTAGEVVTAANLLAYLQSQVTMSFASTAARDAALTGSAAPAEGVMVWVNATIDVLYRYDGANWVVFAAKGAGSPEGVVTANIGSIFERTDGGASTSFYVKESGTGSTGWVAYGAPSAPANDSASVATGQTTTSTSYTDLATAGPAVTVTTGTKALVILSASSYNTTINDHSYMGVAISGATTVAAADTFAQTISQVRTASDYFQVSLAMIVTGLTAGSNTFTAKYKADAATAGFSNRNISVVNMGS